MVFYRKNASCSLQLRHETIICRSPAQGAHVVTHVSSLNRLKRQATVGAMFEAGVVGSESLPPAIALAGTCTDSIELLHDKAFIVASMQEEYEKLTSYTI